jgi:hypothetical protein
MLEGLQCVRACCVARARVCVRVWRCAHKHMHECAALVPCECGCGCRRCPPPPRSMPPPLRASHHPGGSYGVLLIQLYAGELVWPVPLPPDPAQRVRAVLALTRAGHMPALPATTDPLFVRGLIVECTRRDPGSRPTFATIADALFAPGSGAARAVGAGAGPHHHRPGSSSSGGGGGGGGGGTGVGGTTPRKVPPLSSRRKPSTSSVPISPASSGGGGGSGGAPAAGGGSGAGGGGVAAGGSVLPAAVHSPVFIKAPLLAPGLGSGASPAGSTTASGSVGIELQGLLQRQLQWAAAMQQQQGGPAHTPGGPSPVNPSVGGPWGAGAATAAYPASATAATADDPSEGFTMFMSDPSRVAGPGGGAAAAALPALAPAPPLQQGPVPRPPAQRSPPGVWWAGGGAMGVAAASDPSESGSVFMSDPSRVAPAATLAGRTPWAGTPLPAVSPLLLQQAVAAAAAATAAAATPGLVGGASAASGSSGGVGVGVGGSVGHGGASGGGMWVVRPPPVAPPAADASFDPSLFMSDVSAVARYAQPHGAPAGAVGVGGGGGGGGGGDSGDSGSGGGSGGSGGSGAPLLWAPPAPRSPVLRAAMPPPLPVPVQGAHGGGGTAVMVEVPSLDMEYGELPSQSQ